MLIILKMDEETYRGLKEIAQFLYGFFLGLLLSLAIIIH